MLKTTSFLIVDDHLLIHNIAEIIDKPFIMTAKAVIVCITEVKKIYHGFSFEVEDCSAAVENMLLAVSVS